MGVARPVAVAALGVVAVAASPEVPAGAGVLLAGLGLLGIGWAPAATLATVVAWTAGAQGALGGVVVGAALGALAWSAWRGGASGRVGLAVAAVAGVEALRQHAAATVLPAAVAPAAELLAGLLVAGGAFEAAAGRGEVGRPAGGATAGRLLAAGALLGAGILAARGAPPAWTYPDDVASLRATADPPVPEEARLALVRVAPDEDAAALITDGPDAIGAALDAGWRPWRACGSDAPALRLSWWPRGDAGAPCVDEGARAIRVAAALDRRGRGGEALRLLRRHPRRGRVDWEMALYEAAQGEPSRWRGFVAPGADSLPGRLDWPLHFLGNGEATRELVAAWALGELVIEGEGQAFDGPPTVAVLLDGQEVGRCAFDGRARCTLPVPIAAGPHRLRLVFDSDRTGAGGDRNVSVFSLTAR